ncbi:FAD-dependent monooxygenase [Kribbella albertanoniae]|uniref:Monooxygenase n=1 Tax=Kribbella albertanoniae TaxID=1266829 RepID=A0A4R4QH91_9ACTN|nr:FAD-dependent monooxygenase [Kribbella albertanoniae]TDC34998.1 monooxygenase [Kribbella albertanoniae]
MSKRRAVIVGAGIGGLAAGIALHRRGWEISVLERAAELREVGAGISLWPNSVRALDLLGVGDQVRDLGGIEAAAGFRDSTGRWLFRSDIAAIRERYGDTLMIRRPDLLDILRSALPAESVVLDAEVHQVRPLGGQMAVVHSRGEHIGDVIVGADGIRSTVRAQLWPTAKPPVYAGYTTWRLMTPPLRIQVEASESWGRGERVGIFPLSDGSIYSYLTASVPPDHRHADDHAELQRRFGRWHQPIPAMLESVRNAEILRHDIYRLPPLDRYAVGRTVLVGDAAHAMTPDFGQGGGTALEDSVELAEVLDDIADVATALLAYDRRRRARTQAIARQSALFGSVAQWSSPPLALLRNALLGVLPPAVLLRSLKSMLSWHA